MKRKIKMLLPKGSLNTPGRGDTNGLIKDAGYDIVGYESGKENDKELRIKNDPEIELMLARPQSAPNELIQGMADIAIIGEDWVLEETFRKKGIVKVADLKYATTRLVFAAKDKYDDLDDFLRKNDKVICYSEMVNLTCESIKKSKVYKELYGDEDPVVQMRGNRFGTNNNVTIVMSDGVTEGYISKGANLISDTVQSGKSLIKYGLTEVDSVLVSNATLFARKEIIDPWVLSKIEDIKYQLIGAVNARQKDYVVFNLKNENFDKIMGYVKENNLYSDEPTVIEGKNFSQVSILVEKKKWPSISKGLREIGATSIMRYESKQIID